MTALHVTHDLEEAEVLSDRILHWNELSTTVVSRHPEN